MAEFRNICDDHYSIFVARARRIVEITRLYKKTVKLGQISREGGGGADHMGKISIDTC